MAIENCEGGGVVLVVGTHRFLQNSAVSCGENLRFPAVLLRKSAPPKCRTSYEQRESAKISENQHKKTAHLSPFVSCSLFLLISLECWTW